MDIECNIQKASFDIEAAISGSNKINTDAGIQHVDIPKATWQDFISHFHKWKNFKILLSTAFSWFLLDVTFYGLNLNTSTILKAISFGSLPANGAQTVYDNLHNICIGHLILAAAGLIPSYLMSFLFIDLWGHKPIQLMGFTILTIFIMIMDIYIFQKSDVPGFGFNKFKDAGASSKAFVFLYCLANFFSNFGPNMMTFIFPGGVFPTCYHSTGHGISAASGKLGAIISQFSFTKLKDCGGTNKFVKHILKIFALFMLTGIFSTLLLLETKNRTLEELSNEDQDGFV
ncbi:Inorganic phosphate transporter PHO84 [Leucoagaricus sp. SymC.cos]|nr:Inorganic phosphate transporter PHO84 [Leucoagaricus sp. SymC.cos]